MKIRKKDYAILLVVLLCIIVAVNLFIVSSEIYSYINKGVNKCSMGFGGSVECSLSEAIQNNVYFFNTTIGVILYPSVILISILVLIIIKKKNEK